MSNLYRDGRALRLNVKMRIRIRVKIIVRKIPTVLEFKRTNCLRPHLTCSVYKTTVQYWCTKVHHYIVVLTKYDLKFWIQLCAWNKVNVLHWNTNLFNRSEYGVQIRFFILIKSGGY